MHCFSKKSPQVASTIFCQVDPLGYIGPVLKDALLRLDRAHFLPPANRDVAYADAPIVLKRRCEFPFFILAHILQGLGLETTTHTHPTKAAVISAGTGYSACLLSVLCDAVEVFEGDSILYARLLEVARKNPKCNPVTMLTDDPVDAILMDGGAYDTIPENVVRKLRPGGKLAIIQPIESSPKTSAAVKTLIRSSPRSTNTVLHPTSYTLSHPLCDALIYTKNMDDTLHPDPKRLLQVHIPRLCALTQNESFNFFKKELQ